MNSKDTKNKKNLEIDPNDSECEDDESTIYKSEARKTQEKQQEIDDLNKRLRFLELEYKKKEIEISADLANERTRANELQEILTHELDKLKENREANELSERLVLVENELFEKQQIAHDILHQLTQMELENEQLKAELERSKNTRVSQQQSLSASSSNDPSHFHSSPTKLPGDLDVEQLVTRCLELEREKQDLIHEVEQIRSGAIDAIVEKEKFILDLQEALEQSKQLLLQQHSITSLNDLNSATVSTSSSAAAADAHFHENMERLRYEYESELGLLNARCEDLQTRLDTESKYHEEQLQELDASISQRVYENVQSHIDSAKNNEADLLQQLSLLDERAKTQERHLAEAQKALAHARDESKRERDVYDAKIARISKQCESLEEAQKQSRGITKELEEAKKVAEKDLHDKQNLIEKLTMKRDDLLKNTVNLEAENKRLKDNIAITKSTVSQLEASVESLYNQLDQTQNDSQHLLKAAELRFEAEKSKLFDELLKLKSSSSETISINSVQQRLITIDSNDTPLTPKKNQSSSRVEEILEDEEIVVQNNQSTTKLTSTTKDNKQSNNNNNNIQSTSLSSEKLSSILGQEFNDEDFNLEDEEEKTESSSIISSSLSPSKNNGSKTSPSAAVHPISNESIRANFKNQFRVGAAPVETAVVSAAPTLPNPAETNQLIIELKAKISKYECTITSYEARIERIQNESKAMLTQLQEARREKVQSHKEAELIDELNTFKAHCHRVETQFVTQKLQLTEDLHYFKNELRIQEVKNAEMREELTIATSERTVYQVKYAKLKGILKHRRTGGTSSGAISVNNTHSTVDPYLNNSYKQTPAAMNQFSNSPFNSPTSQMIRQHAAAQSQSTSTSSSNPSGHAKKKSFWIFK